MEPIIYTDWKFILGCLCLLVMAYGLSERQWTLFNFALIVFMCCAGGLVLKLV
jgi:hypothetical protein